MNKDSLVVLMAAGASTRYVDENGNQLGSKCVAPIVVDDVKGTKITPITATINACLSRGLNKFLVVLGTHSDQVKTEVSRLATLYGAEAMHVKYLELNTSDSCSCYGYSLYEVFEYIKNNTQGINTAYIMDGDTLISPEHIGRLTDTPAPASLVRDCNWHVKGRSLLMMVDNRNQDLTIYHAMKLSMDNINYILTDKHSNNRSIYNEREIYEHIVNNPEYTPVFMHPLDGYFDVDTTADIRNIEYILRVR